MAEIYEVLELANSPGKWRMTVRSDESGAPPYGLCEHEHGTPDEARACPTIQARMNGVFPKPPPQFEKVVARSKITGKYAYLGENLMMGRTIEHTDSLERADNFHSASGIMNALGGHYMNYEAVRVTMDEIGIDPYPSEKEVWGD